MGPPATLSTGNWGPVRATATVGGCPTRAQVKPPIDKLRARQRDTDKTPSGSSTSGSEDTDLITMVSREALHAA